MIKKQNLNKDDKERIKTIDEKYETYDEDGRLKTVHGKFEYVTTMKYIKKYLKKGMRVIELGAGTGAYSVELAKEGYDVTAVELLKHNLDILKHNGEGLRNLHPLQGDALDLSRFADNSYDIVLSFGPMYHLFTEDDQMRALSEAVRICKPNGILMFAYLTHGSIFWNYAVRKGRVADEDVQTLLQKDGSFKNVVSEVFASYFVDEFAAQFKNLPTKHLKDVATDGPASMMRDYIEKMTDHEVDLVLDYHLKTCERKDMQGLSSHMLYICKKSKE